MSERTLLRVSAVAGAAYWPFLLPAPGAHRLGVELLAAALVGLSQTPTLGWLRVVTLYQPAAAAAGAAMTATLLEAGQALPLALLAAAAGGSAVALAAVAPLPAGLLRTNPGRGAVAVASLTLTGAYWALAPQTAQTRVLARPVLFGVDLTGDRALYLTGLLVVAGVYVGLDNLRRSEPGRRLIAAGWAPELADRSGSDLHAALVYGAALSGLCAGTAGWLVALLQRGMPAPGAFSPALAFVWLAIPVVGGAPWPAGALVGAVVVTLVPVVGQPVGADSVVVAGVALALGAAALPQGLVGLARQRLRIRP